MTTLHSQECLLEYRTQYKWYSSASNNTWPLTSGYVAMSLCQWGEAFPQVQVGDVPKYDCSSEQPLDAQDAERRAAERIEGSGRTMYVASAPRRSRPRCFNCGSYYHALKVGAAASHVAPPVLETLALAIMPSWCAPMP